VAVLFPIPQNSDLEILRELITRKNMCRLLFRNNISFKMCDVDSKNYIVKLIANISKRKHIFHTLSVERSAFFVRHRAVLHMVRSNDLLL
jgi:hypothetical protein